MRYTDKLYRNTYYRTRISFNDTLLIHDKLKQLFKIFDKICIYMSHNVKIDH